MSTTPVDATDEHHEALVARHRTQLFERIGGHLERCSWDRATLEAHQEQGLRALLGHAIERSPFHRRRLSGVDPSGFRLADLATLPVMTKDEMMASFDDIVTDPRLSLDVVEAHIAGMGGTPRYLLDEFLVLTSGGSSGVRGVFVLGWDAAIDFAAPVFRAGILHPTELRPDRRPGRNRLSMVGAGKGYHGTRAAGGVFAGAVYDVQSLPATMPIDELVAALDEFQPDQLNGYPSRLATLLAEQRAGRLHIAPGKVTFWAEPFDDELRIEVHDTWGARVVNSFGSSEGLMGMSDPDGATIRLAEDLAIVELVDDDLRPVPPGTPSACVLVTSIFNPVQPLIRYRLDDVMVEHTVDDGSGLRHVVVEGRSDDPFRYGDVVVHPLTFRSVLTGTAAVTEYQVRQTPDGADLQVVASAPVDPAALAATLEASLRTQGVASPVVRIELVDRLERHAATGKIRRFVPLANR